MNVGRYRLLAQREAARDGVSYRAQDSEGGVVEVRILDGARTDSVRWELLARRLRLAVMLEHPGALQVRQLALEHEPPFVALEWTGEKNLGEDLSARVPLPGAEVVALGCGLAEALTAAHRLGLAHGRLCPSVIHLTPDQEPKIDFTGLEVRSASGPQGKAPLEALFRAPELESNGMLASAADIYSLGALFLWLLTAQAPQRDRNGQARGPLPLGELAETCRNAPAAARDLERLIHAMLATEPGERPPARAVARVLTEILARVKQPALQPQATIDSGTSTLGVYSAPTR